MGCAGSKLDDLEAVALCRHRSQYLAEAIEHRYALADAHDSYVQSLRSVGLRLHKFILVTDASPPFSPVLPLPPQRKGDPLPSLSHIYPVPSPSPPPPPITSSTAAAAAAAIPETAHRHSHSNSGPHLQFRSSDDDDDDDDDGPLHSDHSSPLHHHLDLDDNETTTTTTKTYYNFARKGPPASAVTYEQQPFGNDVNHVQVGGFGGGDPSMVPSGSSYPHNYADPYLNRNQNYYAGDGSGSGSGGGYGYAYSFPYPPGFGVMGGGGFFGSPPPTMAPPPPPAEASPSSRAPPPPPSPPKASTWDFLNPFEAYDNYHHIYTPSRSSRDLREEEGIPDLEDEEHEVVKEAYGDEKFAAGPSTSSAKGGDVHSTTGKGVAMEEEDGKGIIGEEKRYQTRNIGVREGEVHLTEKNVLVDEVLQRPLEGELRRKVVPGSRSVPDAVHEIEAQFNRASASCEEISKMLEVGKIPYHRRKYEVVSSKMRNAITPSLSTAATSMTSTSKASEHSDNASVLRLDFDEEKGMNSGNLSSTLQKLYVWEKKLLEEVKAEEMMRLRHDRKSKKLRRLDNRGAEHHKIESTRGLVIKLSTKIEIAIQVVDSISNRIDKLRDEDLWPQLHELIQGLIRMWQVMTECHKSQCQAVIESNSLDAIVSAFAGKLPDDDHMEATMHLGLALLKWIESFSSWIDAQKCYVRSLNGWLMKCLPDEREETADGVAPFSPGRLGAPPVFVICNHWSQTIDRISEREVVEAMVSFTSRVLQVWKQHYGERHRKMMANRERDQKLERDDQKIHKTVETLNKRRALVARHSDEIIHLNQATEISSLSLKSSLQEIFEAMERYSENSMKAYEQLGIRCKEENDDRRNARTS